MKPPPKTIFGITDEAFKLANDAIDDCRATRSALRKYVNMGLGDDPIYTPKQLIQFTDTAMSFLKDIRDLLRMSDNFDA